VNGCKAVWPEAGLDRSAAPMTRIYKPSPRKKMIMTLEARDKLMSLTDVSEMLGIPFTLCTADGTRATGQPAIG
jgi:hypothetical protein